MTTAGREELYKRSGDSWICGKTLREYRLEIDRGDDAAWEYSDEEDDRGEVEWKRTTVEDQDDERAKMIT